MNLHPTNALAGPSKTQDSLQQLFLPPSSDHPKSTTHLKSTQDLLTRFQLLATYDKHVRPYATPAPSTGDVPPTPHLLTNGFGPGAVDKGKGKERDTPDGPVAAAPTPGAAGQDGDEDGKGDKKKRNNYKHLIKGIPGKHSMKKDDYLMTMMQVDPKQRMVIEPFDARTQERSFAVSADGLKGWNIGVLVGESAQAKEDRKKRKELKKLAKTQGTDGVISAPTPGGLRGGTAPPTPAGAPPQPAGVPAAKPAIPRPGSRTAQTPAPSQAHASTRPGTPLRGATPVVATPSQSSSVVAAPPQRPPTTHPLPSRPVAAPVTTQAPAAAMRGKKREFEDPDSAHPQGNGHQPQPSAAIVGAKAGVAGVRPRPVKKARMDAHGIARDMPVQQPTPQGV